VLRQKNKMQNKKVWIYGLLTIIVIGGFFLRFYDINHAPPGVYPDEAVNGTDAARANETGQYQWFYPDNQGREGLMMNLVALCFKIFGISVLALKLPSIISGTLAVLGMFLLGREIFNNRIGLISAFLLAVSFWSINFSRISFRANLLPTVLIFSFYFLFLGLRTKKWHFYAIGGFIFGIGMHTYIAWRIAPLILILLLVFVILSRRNFLKENWKLVTIFLAASLIAAAPMFWTFYIHPEYLESRSDSISILSPKMNNGDLARTFVKTLSLSLSKYNFWGDQNWRDNYPPYPMLDTLTGVAFFFGLILSFGKFFKLLYQRIRHKIKDSRLEVYTLLLFWFFLMLVPEFMTNEGLPHALRSIGTLPVVLIFAAIAFEYILALSEKYGYLYQKLVLSLILVAFIAIGLFNPLKYFFFWAQNVKTAQAFEKNITDLAFYVKSLPPTTEVYAVLGNMQRVPPRLFNWGNPNFHDMHPLEIDKINPKNTSNFVVVFSDYYKDETLKNLTQRFPNLRFQEIKDRFGLKYYILK